MVVVNASQELGFARDGIERPCKLPHRSRRDIHAGATGDDRIEQIALAERSLDRAKQLLLQARELCQPEREARIVAECAEIAQVIGDPLELEEQRSQPERPARYGARGDALERLAIGP